MRHARVTLPWQIRCREPISGTLMQESRFSVPDTFFAPFFALRMLFAPIHCDFDRSSGSALATKERLEASDDAQALCIQQRRTLPEPERVWELLALEVAWNMRIPSSELLRNSRKMRMVSPELVSEHAERVRLFMEQEFVLVGADRRPMSGHFEPRAV